MDSIQSSTSKYLQVAVTTLSGYIVVENLVDFLNGSKKLGSIKNTYFFAISFVAYVFITAIVRFYNDINYLLWNDISQVEMIIFFCTTRYMTSQYGKYFWESVILKFAFLCGCTGSLLMCFSARISIISSSLLSDSIGITYLVLQWFYFFVIIIYSIRWIYHVRNISKDRVLTKEEKRCSFYLLLDFTVLASFWCNLIYHGLPTIQNMNIDCLIANQIFMVAYIVILSFYEARTFIEETSKYKVITFYYLIS
jgi:hypothetical protein